MDEINAAPVAAAPLKKKFNWKALVVIAVALLLVAGLVWAVLSLGNSRTSPISLMQKYANAKSVETESYAKDLLAGSDGGKASKLIRLMRKSEVFANRLADQEELFAECYEDMLDEYGSNYKISYKNDKSVEEELEKDDLKACRAAIKEMGEDFYELGKALGKLKGDDLRDLADDLDMSTADLKALIACVKELGQQYRGAEVSEGWELSVLSNITGSELDDPEEDDLELIVLKINGKWVKWASSNASDRLQYLIPAKGDLGLVVLKLNGKWASTDALCFLSVLYDMINSATYRYR